MGIKLIILLALLVGVLYCLHLLVKDYQALSAARVLRLLFKRDLNSQHIRPSVKWKRILLHDPIQCARYVYCDMGAQPGDNAVRRGFAFMLTLEPLEEDKGAWEVFKAAYEFGKSLKPEAAEECHTKYSICPFQASVLFNFMQYLINNNHQNIYSYT